MHFQDIMLTHRIHHKYLPTLMWYSMILDAIIIYIQIHAMHITGMLTENGNMWLVFASTDGKADPLCLKGIID